jgi:Cupin domain
MNPDDGALDVERLAASSTGNFSRRIVELPALSVLDDDAVDWEGAIVFVTAGEVEIVCQRGARAIFRAGDILCFAPFPGFTVRNGGSEPARLLAVWRR